MFETAAIGRMDEDHAQGCLSVRLEVSLEVDQRSLMQIIFAYILCIILLK